MTDDGGRFRVSGIQVAAGAAAAATAAFAASALGVAGTIVGAALVSASITVLAAVYDHSLRRARHRLATSRRPGAPAAQSSAVEPDGGGSEPDNETTATLVLPALDLEGEDGYHWRRIAVASLLLFAAAMALVTGFELVTGRPVSSLFSGDDEGGTTIGRVVQRPHRTATPTPTPSPTPTATTSSVSTPSVTPTPSPTVTVTVTTSAAPTPSTTRTPTPTATATGSPVP